MKLAFSGTSIKLDTSSRIYTGHFDFSSIPRQIECTKIQQLVSMLPGLLFNTAFWLALSILICPVATEDVIPVFDPLRHTASLIVSLTCPPISH
jgi:hypothetical protein